MSAIASRALDVQRGDRESAGWAGRTLLVATGVLVAFGLLSLYSASSFLAQSRGLADTHFAAEQAVWAGVGAAALAAARFVDYRLYRRLAWPLMGVTLLLLVVLVLPGTEGVAPRINGARRWIRAGISFQPSELAKVAVVVWTAALAVKKRDRLGDFRSGILPFVAVVGAACLLVLAEPHLSAALILAALAGAVLFAAGAKLRHFGAVGLLAAPVVWLQALRTGYPVSRLAALFDPTGTPGAVEYQVRQALIAVGSGGLLGVGFGASRQKLFFVPEPQNDFIFSIIAEEWGFVGSAALIGLFAVWTVAALRIAATAPDAFGRLLAVGLAAMVGIGAFGHLGVNLGLLPPTGINLPFVSAGGTHLVLSLASTGALLNIASSRG